MLLTQEVCRAEINVTVVVDGGVQVLNYELSPSTTIELLRSFVAAETDKSADSFQLRYNNNIVSDDSRSLADIGFKGGDILTATSGSAAVSGSAGQPSGRPNQQPSAASSSTPIDNEIEQFRQTILSNENMRRQFLAQNSQLGSVLNDPSRFRQAVEEAQRQRSQQLQQYQTEVQSLNDDVNEENQAKIMERIRLDNIEREMDEAMQANPEFYGRVTMLYIQVEVNGHPVKAFVDSGAQSTIMSPSCAEACNITRLIDTRWSGVARGVGTAKILGRVHRANVKIGEEEVPCAFTVMEGKDVDMLFGLDMLKRYQACIDLQGNCLRFPNGVSVQFLPEAEIPKNFEEVAASEPQVQGPGGATIGANTGTVNPPATSAEGSSSPSSSSNFKGQGQSLGATGTSQAARSSSSSAPAPASAAAPAPGPARSQPPTSSAAAAFPQKDIDILIQMGATREQAIQALQATGGNVDYAASLVLDSL